jgi:phytoene synthase
MARKTSFYYSFLVLPAEQRRAIVAVWDFCRAVDDAVDERPPEADQGQAGREAVCFWRAELARCFDAGTPHTRQGRRLQPLVAEFDLPRRAFEDVIDGVAMDLDTSRYETFGDLFEYCRRVASAVGLICIKIFGCQSAQAREYAINLGLALQAHQHPARRQRRSRARPALPAARRTSGRAAARSRRWRPA